MTRKKTDTSWVNNMSIEDLTNEMHETIVSVHECINKQNIETQAFIDKDCEYGLAIPSLIARIRWQMTREVMDSMKKVENKYKEKVGEPNE